MNETADQRPGYLYRHWSATGELLYVGISINAVARLGQHRRKPWFSEIAKITVQKFDAYAKAEQAELRAICRERPLHNIKGPRTPEALKIELTKLRAAQRRAATRPAKPNKVRRMYDIDMIFGCIPPDLTFEEYAKSPKKWSKWAEEKRARLRAERDRAC